MQEPKSGPILLFCDTTRMQAMARESLSILFNTARF